jgi:hypothetical protein
MHVALLQALHLGARGIVLAVAVDATEVGQRQQAAAGSQQGGWRRAWQQVGRLRAL